MKEIRIKYHADIDEICYIGGEKSNWIDLRAAESYEFEPFEYKQISLGVSIELPPGFEALIAPRSSTFSKYGLLLTNGIGIIDESYKGDNDIWMFPALAMRKTFVQKNDRICQFRIIKHQPEIEFDRVVVLGNPDRHGLGSTGKR